MNDVRTCTVVCCYHGRVGTEMDSWNYILEYYYDARTHEH